MQIQIVDVGTPNTLANKSGRTYQSIEVTYKGIDGKVGSKKLVSFSNPDVFKFISGLSKGDAVDVVTQKDDNGYWQWTGINKGGESLAQSTTSSAPATRVTGSTYETKEERAARQVLIVRQSSLSSAIATLAVGSKSAPTSADVIALAKEYEDYVFDKKVDESFVDTLEDDIPY